MQVAALLGVEEPGGMRSAKSLLVTRIDLPAVGVLLATSILVLAGFAAAQGRTQPPSLAAPAPSLGAVDLVNPEGFTIGGRAVRPGGSVQLGPREAARLAGGKCFYEVAYGVTNAGGAPTPQPFTVRLRADGSAVGSHEGLSLRSREARTLRSVVGLSPGQHVLELALDDDGRVPESNERNNQVRALLTVVGSCDPPPDVARAPGPTGPITTAPPGGPNVRAPLGSSRQSPTTSPTPFMGDSRLGKLGPIGPRTMTTPGLSAHGVAPGSAPRVIATSALSAHGTTGAGKVPVIETAALSAHGTAPGGAGLVTATTPSTIHDPSGAGGPRVIDTPGLAAYGNVGPRVITTEALSAHGMPAASSP